MQAWIFQGNPDYFDVDAYLGSNTEIYWSVTRKSHQERINLGDPVFIWRAMGSKRNISGIVAFGHVSEQCKPKREVSNPEHLSDHLWDDPDQEKSRIKVGIKLENIRLCPENGMLTSDQIKLNEELSNMQILTVRSGSNFPISDSEFIQVSNLWSLPNSNQPYFSSPEYSANEGRIYYRLHRAIERDRKIVSLAKEEFLRTNGRLFCEICGFDFNEKYGDIANGYIEAHHKKPVHLLGPDEKTKVQDFLMLCANCHRIIHRGDPQSNYPKLLKLFK